MSTGARGRQIVLVIMLFALQVFLAFHIRLRAWPETLVPAYLVSRGWTLYREVKFIHTPLWIGIEALVSAIFGISALTLRALALAPALACHLALWHAGKRLGWTLPARVGASLFFLGSFYLWDGNAVYPDVAIAALTIPVYLGLRKGTPRGAAVAGFLLGAGIAIKQPAAMALLLAAIWVTAVHRLLLPRFLAFAALPWALCAAVFALLGAERDFLIWTAVVPFHDYRGRTNLPINPAQLPIVLLGFLCLAVFLFLSLPDRDRSRSSAPALLTLLTLGLSTMAFPKFELVHLIPAVPLLAIAAGSAFHWAGRSAGVTRLAAAIPAAVIALDFCFLATDTSTGEISFWDSALDDAIVRRLSALPPAPLYLYGPDQNLFIRSGRLPPGRLYSNPDLWYHFRAEGFERNQIESLRDHPEAIVLKTSGGAAKGDAGLALAAWIAEDYKPESGWPSGVERVIPK